MTFAGYFSVASRPMVMVRDFNSFCRLHRIHSHWQHLKHTSQIIVKNCIDPLSIHFHGALESSALSGWKCQHQNTPPDVIRAAIRVYSISGSPLPWAEIVALLGNERRILGLHYVRSVRRHRRQSLDRLRSRLGETHSASVTLVKCASITVSNEIRLGMQSSSQRHFASCQ